MAHENSKVTGFAVDNAAGTLTSISGSVNQVSIDGGMELLEDTGLGDTIRTFVDGLANGSNVSVNGMLDSTTRGIFAPLTNGTTVAKTIEVKVATGDYWTGEAWPERVSLSSSPGAINTWSCTFRAVAGLTSTSVTAVS